MCSMENNPGIASLGGYAYQIKVFISLLPYIKENDTIEFETIDDISISEKDIDNKSEYMCTTQSDNLNNKLTAIQVKKTQITKASLKKIWYNWLIVYNKNNSISKFELRYDKTLNSSFDLYSISSNEMFKLISKSKAKKNSLESKVKQIYSDEKVFEASYTFIKNNSKEVAIENIDEQIHNQYKALFHWTDSFNETYKLRVEELCKTIQNIILNSIEKKKPYICTHDDFYNIVEEISNRITKEEYIPNYALFSNNVAETLHKESIINSREFKQLLACKITESTIRLFLTNQSYYNDYRYRSLRNLKAEKIENTEITAYENFCIVVEKLRQENNDCPYKRLDLTTSQSNAHAPDEQIKRGVCIHLTEDGVEETKRISWSDEID